MTKQTVTFRTETTSIPALAVGDLVRAHRFLAKVVAKRDYPRVVNGVTHGDATRPCSQVDLELIQAEDQLAARDFRHLATGNNGLAQMQGNHLATITRLHRIKAPGPRERIARHQAAATQAWQEWIEAQEVHQ